MTHEEARAFVNESLGRLVQQMNQQGWVIHVKAEFGKPIKERVIEQKVNGEPQALVASAAASAAHPRHELEGKPSGDLCQVCGSILVYKGSCPHCPSCNFDPGCGG